MRIVDNITDYLNPYIYQNFVIEAMNEEKNQWLNYLK